MIASLQKINIIAPRKYQEEILDILQSLGLVHIIRQTNRQKKNLQKLIDDLNLKLANIKFTLNFLGINLKEKQSLGKKLSFARKSLSYRQIKKKISKLKINFITLRITDIEKNLTQGQIKLQETEAQLKEIEPWINLTEKPQDTQYTKTTAGIILLNKYPEFSRQLENQITELAHETLYQDQKRVYLQITYLKPTEEKIKNILEEFNFQVQKAEIEGSPAQEIAKLKKERLRLKNILKKWRQYINKFKKYIEPLKMAEDLLTWEREKLQTKQTIAKTKFFIVIKAWIKREDLKTLKNSLKDISLDILIKPIKTKFDESPPVIIENNNFIRPFESVTGIYGIPRYSEIDPTPYLAPFFIIFFALCLTDAGYGLVMALGTFLAIKLLKIPRDKQKLFRLLGYGGVATFVIGALFGGWFGIDVSILAPGPVRNFIEFFKIIDPMQDTVLFMVISFTLGVLQIWFSQIVKAISAAKNKNKGELISGLTWAGFLACGITVLIAKLIRQSTLTNIAFYIMLMSLLGLIITESRNTKIIFIKPLVGIIAIIQKLISFMSDTLSYSRLMALGLATGIIAFIVNTIAAIFRDLIPYVGWIVWVLILIGGHIFNLGISALGSFIHSGRLQFVEFFPKFMEGGGERFVPFKRTSKYFNLSG